jgi:hypothetical protein
MSTSEMVDVPFQSVLAFQLYRAYAGAGKYQTSEGETMPHLWRDIEKQEQNRWLAVAEEAISSI